MRAVDRVGIPTPLAGTVRRDVITAPTTLAQTNFALSSSVNMTSAGTAHTKGAWVEVVASTADEIDRLLIQTGNVAAGGASSASLMDIGVGAAGSEVVVIPDVMMGWASSTFWDIPISIPAGSRIAARYQSARTSLNCAVQVVALKRNSGATQRPASYAVSIGTDTSTSAGVTTIPGSSNAKGAWAELTSSCPVSLQGLQIGVGCAGNTNVQGATVRVDIGVGAAGAETTVIPDFQVVTSTIEVVTRNIATFFYFPARIPRGARIAARCSNTSGASAYSDVSLVGIPRSAP